jgi:hypothetical protein
MEDKFLFTIGKKIHITDRKCWKFMGKRYQTLLKYLEEIIKRENILLSWIGEKSSIKMTADHQEHY